MAKKEQFICDVCGKTKQEVNHWWLIDDSDDPRPSIEVIPWREDMLTAARDPLKHICGQQCVAKFLSEWMQK